MVVLTALRTAALEAAAPFPKTRLNLVQQVSLLLEDALPLSLPEEAGETLQESHFSAFSPSGCLREKSLPFLLAGTRSETDPVRPEM